MFLSKLITDILNWFSRATWRNDAIQHSDILALELQAKTSIDEELIAACHALINIRTTLAEKADRSSVERFEGTLLANFRQRVDDQLSTLYNMTQTSISREPWDPSPFEPDEIGSILIDYQVAYGASEIKPDNEEHLWYIDSLKSLMGSVKHRP